MEKSVLLASRVLPAAMGTEGMGWDACRITVHDVAGRVLGGVPVATAFFLRFPTLRHGGGALVLLRGKHAIPGSSSVGRYWMSTSTPLLKGICRLALSSPFL